MAEQVSVQWVMEARRASTAEGVCQEDVAQPTDGVEPRSEANVAPPLTKPNIVPSETERPLSSPVEAVADVIVPLQ